MIISYCWWRHAHYLTSFRLADDISFSIKSLAGFSPTWLRCSLPCVNAKIGTWYKLLRGVIFEPSMYDLRIYEVASGYLGNFTLALKEIVNQLLATSFKSEHRIFAVRIFVASCWLFFIVFYLLHRYRHIKCFTLF